MKPMHVGLLVAGAALASGLAVRMTQPPSGPAVARPASPVAAASRVALPAVQTPAPPLSTPLPVKIRATTPSPVTVAAPPPVFENPDPPKPVRKPSPVALTPPKAKTPQLIARQTEPAVPLPSPLPYRVPAKPIVLPSGAAPVAEQASSPAPEPPVSLPAPATLPVVVPLKVTLKAGAFVSVRLDQTLASDHLAAGDTFQASLAQPIVAGGFVIAERGARVSGRVMDARSAGRFTGSSVIQLSLASFQTADGQNVTVSTEPWLRRGDSPGAQQAAKIGGGAALGAVIGALAGGGMGAAIGAGAGGAIGTGAAAMTGGKPLSIASETVIRFRLASAVTITERQL